jgi:hypothetical protein
MPEIVRVPRARGEQASPEPDVEDNPLFLETMNVVYETFVPRGVEEETKNIIQSGIEAEPSIIAALAYFLTRRGETSLDTVASKFMVNLEELRKARQEYQKQL